MRHWLEDGALLAAGAALVFMMPQARRFGKTLELRARRASCQTRATAAVANAKVST